MATRPSADHEPKAMQEERLFVVEAVLLVRAVVAVQIQLLETMVAPVAVARWSLQDLVELPVVELRVMKPWFVELVETAVEGLLLEAVVIPAAEPSFVEPAEAVKQRLRVELVAAMAKEWLRVELVAAPAEEWLRVELVALRRVERRSEALPLVLRVHQAQAVSVCPVVALVLPSRHSFSCGTPRQWPISVRTRARTAPVAGKTCAQRGAITTVTAKRT